MKITLFILAIVITWLGYHGFILYQKYQIAEELVDTAVAYEKQTNDTSVTLLVLGDSTAVGVGATAPDDTVAALLANEISATHVENYAVSGAIIADLPSQIKKATQGEYDYILIQIGGNDIIQLQAVAEAKATLERILPTIPETDNLYVMSAGNVGATAFFPWFLDGLYTRTSLNYHDMFKETVPQFGGSYINLYEPKERDVFHQNPEKYLAADGLHPSSAGYKIWFEKLSNRLENDS